MTTKKEYPGLDYGLGTANKNHETGIRNGVIHQNEVLQAWCDSSEPYYPCSDCEYKDSDNENGECDFCEPSSYFIDDNEYSAESDSYGDIFITKSPYFTYAQFCSPCAPGACYLTNPVDKKYTDNKCYCFGHDWFENEKAPYPVYSVKTGKRVNK